MNQELISKRIKEIRKKNNLTQAEFADMFNVTYQAVSKWENGKNIPDIEILTKICNKYNIDINELMGNKVKKDNNIFIIISVLITIIIGIIIIFFVVMNNHKDFEFKTISSTCNDFTISGSIAYSKDDTSIYINKINYCGDSKEEYKNIGCTLYKIKDNTETILDRCTAKENINIEKFIEGVEFNINSDIKKDCNGLKTSSLKLVIKATKENDELITYDIPLEFNDTCKIK